MTTRRGFLRAGLTALVAAPAIVRASSLMPVRKYGESMKFNGYIDELRVTGGIARYPMPAADWTIESWLHFDDRSWVHVAMTRQQNKWTRFQDGVEVPYFSPKIELGVEELLHIAKTHGVAIP